jgi:anti-anti-sigma factor
VHVHLCNPVHMPEDRLTPRPVSFTTDGTLDGETYSLRLVGELDLAALPAAQAAVETAFASQWRTLAVDCSSLGFLDSSGLRFIVGVHERCAAEDRRLSITPGPPAVQRIFEITGMEALLPFET